MCMYAYIQLHISINGDTSTSNAWNTYSSGSPFPDNSWKADSVCPCCWGTLPPIESFFVAQWWLLRSTRQGKPTISVFANATCTHDQWRIACCFFSKLTVKQEKQDNKRQRREGVWKWQAQISCCLAAVVGARKAQPKETLQRDGHRRASNSCASCRLPVAATAGDSFHHRGPSSS